MDRLHLIKRLAERHVQLKTKDAEYSVKVILDAMCSTLARGGRIEIRGFGSFSLNQHLPKLKRGSRISHKLKEPAKYIPHFKPAKELRARTNQDDGVTITGICRTLTMPSELLSIKKQTTWRRLRFMLSQKLLTAPRGWIYSPCSSTSLPRAA